MLQQSSKKKRKSKGAAQKLILELKSCYSFDIRIQCRTRIYLAVSCIITY